jgi:hypothetical protein
MRTSLGFSGTDLAFTALKCHFVDWRCSPATDHADEPSEWPMRYWYKSTFPAAAPAMLPVAAWRHGLLTQAHHSRNDKRRGESRAFFLSYAAVGTRRLS